MEPPAREPVSRRGQAIRPALSRAVIVEAALHIADSESLDAVTMRRVAATLDTSASALYVYIQGREDLLDAMFDYVMAAVAQAAIPAALDLLGLFVTAAALDRVPAVSSTPQQHHDLLRWEIEVILTGLATTPPQIPHIR